VRRVRHDTKLRLLEVKSVGRITPKMLRITVGGDELAGFVSAAHDDHVKLFFPQPGQAKPVLPTSSPNGPVYPADAPRPAARDYTPRRYDPTAGTLAIDFVLHGDGPATSWAACVPRPSMGWQASSCAKLTGRSARWPSSVAPDASLRSMSCATPRSCATSDFEHAAGAPDRLKYLLIRPPPRRMRQLRSHQADVARAQSTG
jgi:hypothetical protein